MYNEVKRRTVHQSSVESITFSPDCSRIVSGSVDNTLRLWPASKIWADELCAKPTRNMSRKQWREWVSPEIPCTCTCQCPGLSITPDVTCSAARPELCPGKPVESMFP